MASLPVRDAQVMWGLSNLLSAWHRETLCQFLGFMFGENREGCPLASLLISGRASILCFLPFERLPVRLSHLEESCNSQFLPIASRKREPLRAQK